MLKKTFMICVHKRFKTCESLNYIAKFKMAKINVMSKSVDINSYLIQYCQISAVLCIMCIMYCQFRLVLVGSVNVTQK
jgi:hypothetical protein